MKRSGRGRMNATGRTGNPRKYLRKNGNWRSDSGRNERSRGKKSRSCGVQSTTSGPKKQSEKKNRN
jgi:hypothetical protein